jgi:hypothetical protein
MKSEAMKEQQYLSTHAPELAAKLLEEINSRKKK